MKFIFNPDEWKSPSSHGKNYCQVPKSSGVYLIVTHTMNWLNDEIIWHILYIGCSNNLERRLKYHPMKDICKKKFGFYLIYFLESDNYLDFERELISDVKPVFNKSGKYERVG